MGFSATAPNHMELKDYMRTVGRQARAASRRLAMATTAEKNRDLAWLASNSKV